MNYHVTLGSCDSLQSKKDPAAQGLRLQYQHTSQDGSLCMGFWFGDRDLGLNPGFHHVSYDFMNTI